MISPGLRWTLLSLQFVSSHGAGCPAQLLVLGVLCLCCARLVASGRSGSAGVRHNCSHGHIAGRGGRAGSVPLFGLASAARPMGQDVLFGSVLAWLARASVLGANA
eukprot:8619936-Alexandrium_andersonii.AAC.1